MPAAFLPSQGDVTSRKEQNVEPEWSRMLREHAGVLRLIKAFSRIKDKQVRREAVKLAEKIAGIKPKRRKRRPK